MPKLELTEEQVKNLLVLLSRCPTTGPTEAQALLILNMKAEQAIKPPPSPKETKPPNK